MTVNRIFHPQEYTYQEPIKQENRDIDWKFVVKRFAIAVGILIIFSLVTL